MRAPSGVSRRGFLVGAGAVGAGALVVGAGAAHALEETSTDLVHHPPVDFYGQRQAGIATAQQDRLVFAAFDVVAVLTKGGPLRPTQVFATYAFTVGILSGDMPLGASVSLFMLPFLAVAAAFVLRGVIKRGSDV